MFPTPIQKFSLKINITYRLLLALTLFIWLLPLLAVMMTSIRTFEDVLAGNYWTFPEKTAFISNYSSVFEDGKMARFFLNSLIITLPTVFGTLLLSSLAGYSLAMHRFKLNLLVFAMFIAGNLVPYQILMIPVRSISIELGVYNTHFGLIIFHIAFQTGFCTFFLRNFIKELPFELIEAARVDGATEWTIYRKIILPLITPALAALGVLEFTFIWNDYFWALVLTQGDAVKPITVGLDVLRGQWTTAWNLVSAGSVVAALPPVIMFFILQRQFIQGLTFGAVKG
ncbi:carbohydrate ABC transporter permease [Pelagibacteraceae bacterium]|nr:carbohydrate ABC transporter permease [Pelagibacteraceae bacterium]|tara:strand:+ start:944 stop:1795 length:852 start_codon:yes stop_codon:yes gene_type:complete